ASVMWLYGPAGTGKSAIAQSMAEKWAADYNLAATFFFGRWRAGGGSGKCLFPTIAYQLALHIPGLLESVGLAVEMDCQVPVIDVLRTYIRNAQIFPLDSRVAQKQS
ncbi:hypothetical protein DFH08DRAFT_716038, partial [Mycena albidolilacea]